MRRLLASTVVFAAASLTLGCSDGSRAPSDPDLTVSSVAANAAQAQHFVAPLRGTAEVPPVQTNAVGMAGFNIRNSGTALQYMVMVGRVQNVTMAHIHLAAAGQNGPVVAWLYPPAPPANPIPGESNGVLVEGTITAANLVGPLAGQPLSALIDHMRAGNTYVNLHTVQRPAGEIRGQITGIAILD